MLELTVMAERDPQASGGLVIVDGALVGNSRPLWPYAGVAGAWALAAAALVWAIGGRAAHVAARMPRIEVLDRRLPLGLHLGEVAAVALAAVFALLPAGTPASAWTLVRLVLAAALGALALARPRHVAIAAVAAIPFVGVIARTGIYDRPVGETLIVILVIAWAAHALAQRRWPLRLGAEPRSPEQAASAPRSTPSPLRVRPPPPSRARALFPGYSGVRLPLPWRERAGVRGSPSVCSGVRLPLPWRERAGVRGSPSVCSGVRLPLPLRERVGVRGPPPGHSRAFRHSRECGNPPPTTTGCRITACGSGSRSPSSPPA